MTLAQVQATVAQAEGSRSEFGSLVRGSLLFSLATLFPGLGRYVVAPVRRSCR
jgi:hypothetical protein